MSVYDDIHKGLAAADLDELPALLAGAQDKSYQHRAIEPELARRQAKAQIEAAQSQIDAAEAAKDTARYTKDVARYMFWSVVAVAASAVIALLSFAASVWY